MSDLDVSSSARGVKSMGSERGCSRSQRIEEILKEKKHGIGRCENVASKNHHLDRAV